MLKFFSIGALCFISFGLFAQIPYKTNISGSTLTISSKGKSYLYTGQFKVLYSKTDPNMAFRPAGIRGVTHNVISWKSIGVSDLKKTAINKSQAGDGFDDKILKGEQDARTVNLFNAAEAINVVPVKAVLKSNILNFIYADQKQFKLTASLKTGGEYPELNFQFTPKEDGYYSICYTGAPSFTLDKVSEIWQPMIWQEKRFPDNSYLTPSYLCPLPTTFLNDGANTLGVLADSKYLPFNPLPVLINSQFGVALRDDKGNAKTQIIAPILGGLGSKMRRDTSFNFRAKLVVEPLSVQQSYEKLAREQFGFKDFRHNDIATLNETLDNIVDYSLSKYALFVDSLKGCAYSTDVPDAVKNVSSLNPLGLAILRNDKTMFEKRAYPLMEFMLSREKFLFSLDSTQVIQSPSRKLAGPVAPISELISLYNVFNKQNPLFLNIAKEESVKARKRNLDELEAGNTWQNSLWFYKATGDKNYLISAVAGAEKYLAGKKANRDHFQGSYFFWTSFTNDFIGLFQLYEETKDKKFLDAAQEAARYYTMFTWMSPQVPNETVTVNKDGKAPLYWYLAGKGHTQMYYPETQVPAWRLSEIGLTPESSGTMVGHRAIFMANYAPWLMKIGYYSNDKFLQEVAKSSIIGRYRNFPGYHINTARTNAYEQFDFPYHNFKEQSVNSFHYNHILPMATMLVDYLVTDAFVRSKGKIDFKGEFMEGYAYLQNTLYGSKTGSFYDEKDIQLWMPGKLLKSSNVELNYISGIKGNDLYIAFMNQSDKMVAATIALNDSLVNLSNAMSAIKGNNGWEQAKSIANKSFNVEVAPNGITVIKVQGVSADRTFQKQLLSGADPLMNDYAISSFGRSKAMLFKLGDYSSRAYVYLQDDESKFSEVSLHYTGTDNVKHVINDKAYPFEFTIDLPSQPNGFNFTLEGISAKSGATVKSNAILLGK